jgi:hypothetical protein
MFDCEVKFFLDTKLIDSKNYDNSEVFCFCCCGYEVVYYYLFENVHSKNIWTVKIKIAVVKLVKSLVIFILPGW